MYYPERDFSYHRIFVRYNIAKGSKEYWTETNVDRYREEGAVFPKMSMLIC